MIFEPAIGRRSAIEYEVVNGCWVCTSHRAAGDGRIRLKRNGRMTPLYRIAYEGRFGGIPDGLVIRHECDNPACFNPDHLTVGTQADNVRDSIDRGRHVSGERVGTSKLTADQVEAIRVDTRPQRIIAKEYGVGATAIFNIRHGRRWCNG